MQNKSLLWSVGAVILIFLLILILGRGKSSVPPSQTGGAATTTSSAQATSTASTTVTDLGNGISVVGPAGAKVTMAPVGSSPTQPDLAHKVEFTSDVPATVQTQLQASIDATTASLKKNPSQGGQWLKLALNYKIAGDLTAAQSVWIYMTNIAPTDPTAFANLGDLYQNFLKDYPKAETNYLQAIKLKPDMVDVYTDLYTLYKNQYKTNTSAAAEILARGLLANPNNPTLLALQKQQ